MSIIGKMREKWKAKRDRKALGSAGKLAEGMPNPRIQTQWGDVPEAARKQAAVNMKLDLKKRSDVEQLLAVQLYAGDLEKGRAESRRRYPEAYQ